MIELLAAILLIVLLFWLFPTPVALVLTLVVLLLWVGLVRGRV